MKASILMEIISALDACDRATAFIHSELIVFPETSLTFSGFKLNAHLLGGPVVFKSKV